MHIRHFFSLCLLAVIVSATTARNRLSKKCSNPELNNLTCCKNQMVDIEKYKGHFLAYVCSYKHFSVLEIITGWSCVDSVEICCNMKEGYTAPIGGGFQHSEPRSFKCEGLSGMPEDEPPA